MLWYTDLKVLIVTDSESNGIPVYMTRKLIWRNNGPSLNSNIEIYERAHSLFKMYSLHFLLLGNFNPL